MAEAYLNEQRQARQFAQDFLAANPDVHVAVVAHGGIRLTLDRSGSVYAQRVCTDCRHDIPADCAARAVGEDGYLNWPEEPCYQPKEGA